ncbi:MAG: hypothetical protein JWN99_1264 [Ilumatobacteraceae bacterium]|nr:hypothetical protein [Ilumatobacteraceae bacterium]
MPSSTNSDESRDRLIQISVAFASLPVVDDRPADEIIGYDDNGLPAPRSVNP